MMATIKSKPTSKKYREGWERVFKSKKSKKNAAREGGSGEGGGSE